MDTLTGDIYKDFRQRGNKVAVMIYDLEDFSWCFCAQEEDEEGKDDDDDEEDDEYQKKLCKTHCNELWAMFVNFWGKVDFLQG